MPEGVAASIPAPAGRDNTLPLILGLGAAAFVAYRFWYLPMQARAEMVRQGYVGPDAMSRLGAAGCQVIGAKYGLPPQSSQGICSELGGAASEVLKQLPGLVAGVGAGTGSAVASIGSGVGSAGVSLFTAPIKVAAYGGNVVASAAGGVYRGGRTVVGDVWKGTKNVVTDVVEAPFKLLGKGVKALKFW